MNRRGEPPVIYAGILAKEKVIIGGRDTQGVKVFLVPEISTLLVHKLIGNYTPLSRSSMNFVVCVGDPQRAFENFE